MCSTYIYTKAEAKLKLREKIEVFGAVPRANIRLTDLGPVIIPEHDSFACHEMIWGEPCRGTRNRSTTGGHACSARMMPSDSSRPPRTNTVPGG